MAKRFEESNGGNKTHWSNKKGNTKHARKPQSKNAKKFGNIDDIQGFSEISWTSEEEEEEDELIL